MCILLSTCNNRLFSGHTRAVPAKELFHPLYYKMIKNFKEITGCPVIVNTSFNVRGEPIVCSPDNAYACFMRTDMDYLVMENFLLNKNDQPAFDDRVDWRSEFELD